MRPLLLLAVAALSLHADVTLRYKIDSNPAAVLPPGISDTPALRMKGAKGATSLGRLDAIIDFDRRMLTVIDRERKTFATFPVAEFREKAAHAKAAQTTLPKVDTKSRKTGHTTRILGIQAEETDVTAVMDMDKVSVTMHMSNWTPVAAEILRVPALRELTALNLWYENFLGLGGDDFPIPGLEGLGLRFEMEVHMKMDAAAIDPTKPVFTMKVEATELSPAKLDAALFEIPEGFASAAGEDVLKHILSAPPSTQPTAAQTFVPHLDPVDAPHRDNFESEVTGMVRMIVTVGTDGKVLNAEVTAGTDPLRSKALENIRQYRYRPVLRDGRPVIAMTEATIYFGKGPGNIDPAALVAASRRVTELEMQFPRTPQQVLADLEHDVLPERAALYSTDLAQAAFDAGDLDKAETYAKTALNGKSDENDEWNEGNRTHKGHIVLGRVALRRGDVAAAATHLIAAGKTKGSPQLNSFGPDVTLARDLLAKGETAAVLQYFEDCRTFWKMGTTRLDAWIQDIRAGKPPKF